MMECARILALALLAAAGAAQGGEPPTAAPAQPAMQPLNDGELRAVTRPSPWRLPAGMLPPTAISLRAAAPLNVPGDPLTGHLRALNLLTVDIEIKDVVYNANALAWTPADDGSYKVPLPATVGEIDLRNIRCGPNDSLNFGSVQILGIDLQNTTITVSRNK